MLPIVCFVVDGTPYSNRCRISEVVPCANSRAMSSDCDRSRFVRGPEETGGSQVLVFTSGDGLTNHCVMEVERTMEGRRRVMIQRSD